MFGLLVCHGICKNILKQWESILVLNVHILVLNVHRFLPLENHTKSLEILLQVQNDIME